MSSVEDARVGVERRLRAQVGVEERGILSDLARGVETAADLASELATRGLPVFEGADGPTRSHQFALEAHRWGGGQHAAKLLRQANLLTCGIGLPTAPVPNDVNGLRIGTPELVRLGMGPTDMPHLASLIADGL